MKKPTNNAPIMIVAGEASADLHGAELVEEINRRYPALPIFGAGGQQMRNKGFDAIIPAESMSLAGLTEVLLALPRMLYYMRKLLRAAARRQPSVVVLIDLPDFNLRLAKRLNPLGIPVVYYISPQLWAWRQSRVEQIRKYVDQLLVILPFEKEFYEQHGIPVEFVGHPLVEELPDRPNSRAARKSFGINPSAHPVIALLPGSRKKEVSRNLPIMLQSMKLLQVDFPELVPILPIASTVPRKLVESCIWATGLDVQLITGHSTQVLSAADAAVVCSGTSTLQTALLARPMVVVYRVSWLSYLLLSRLVKVAHIALVNLIAGKRLVPELVQKTFTATNVRGELRYILQNQAKTHQVVEELHHIRQQLGKGGTSARVTDALIRYMDPNSQASGGPTP